VKILNINYNCKNPNKLKHDFDLFFLPSLDVNYVCKNCDYVYLHIVDKPEWLLEQIKNSPKNI